MLFKDGITLVKDKLSKPTIEDSLLLKIKRFFNEAHSSVGRFYSWNHLIVDSSIVLIPKYETGTVSWTQGGYSFTGSGNTFTSDMQGRYIHLSDGENSYKIVYVDTSANQLWVESEIVESSSPSAFEINKRIYVLPPEARFILDVDSIGNNLNQQNNSGLRGKIQSYVDPLKSFPFEPYGEDKYAQSYSTGSVSIAKNSNVFAGSGTSWMSNVRPGYIFTVSNREYRVRRVESDTRIISYNYAIDAVAAGTTYEATPDVGIAILYRNEVTTKRIVPFSYVRKVFNLVNENYDRTNFPKEFDEAIVDLTVAYLAEADNKSDWTTYLQKAQKRLEGLVADGDPSKPPYMQFPPLIPGGMGR